MLVRYDSLKESNERALATINIACKLEPFMKLGIDVAGGCRYVVFAQRYRETYIHITTHMYVDTLVLFHFGGWALKAGIVANSAKARICSSVLKLHISVVWYRNSLSLKRRDKILKEQKYSSRLVRRQDGWPILWSVNRLQCPLEKSALPYCHNFKNKFYIDGKKNVCKNVNK